MDQNGGRIASISMKVHNRSQLNGLRLADEHGNLVVDVEWNQQKPEQGKWTTQSVPAGHEIIGVVCNRKDADHIARIGFLLWKPVKHLQHEVHEDIVKHRDVEATKLEKPVHLQVVEDAGFTL